VTKQLTAEKLGNKSKKISAQSLFEQSKTEGER